MLAMHSKLSISRQACENEPALIYVPGSSRMQSSQQEVEDCLEGAIVNRIYREEFSKGGRMHHKHVLARGIEQGGCQPVRGSEEGRGWCRAVTGSIAGGVDRILWIRSSRTHTRFCCHPTWVLCGPSDGRMGKCWISQGLKMERRSLQPPMPWWPRRPRPGQPCWNSFLRGGGV
jgi:hypothetical protein